jgi:hypothetical protein
VWVELGPSTIRPSAANSGSSPQKIITSGMTGLKAQQTLFDAASAAMMSSERPLEDW